MKAKRYTVWRPLQSCISGAEGTPRVLGGGGCFIRRSSSDFVSAANCQNLGNVVCEAFSLYVKKNAVFGSVVCRKLMRALAQFDPCLGD